MSDLIRHIVPTLRQTTGRAYPALERDLEKLSPEAQRDLLRLLRDLQGEVQQVKGRARRGMPV